MPFLFSVPDSYPDPPQVWPWQHLIAGCLQRWTQHTWTQRLRCCSLHCKRGCFGTLVSVIVLIIPAAKVLPRSWPAFERLVSTQQEPGRKSQASLLARALTPIPPPEQGCEGPAGSRRHWKIGVIIGHRNRTSGSNIRVQYRYKYAATPPWNASFIAWCEWPLSSLRTFIQIRMRWRQQPVKQRWKKRW